MIDGEQYTRRAFARGPGAGQIRAHQAKYAAAAGAKSSVAKLRPYPEVSLAEKYRGGRHRADVLDELAIAMPDRGGPGSPRAH